MKASILIAFLGCASAQITTPQLGAMLTRDGVARPVYGISNSVTIGDPLASSDPASDASASSGGATSISPVVSMGCSRALCLMKTDSAVVILGRSASGSARGYVAAPPGPAIFSFSHFHSSQSAANQPNTTDTAALVYFPEVGQLARWHDNSLEQVAFDVSGEILSVRNGLFAVRRDTGVWIVQSGDRIVQVLPPGVRHVLLLDDGVLFATINTLVLLRTDTTERRFAIEHIESLSWLSDTYVQVRTPESTYALRIDRNRELLFLLPEGLPEPKP